jgi:hypothetical protein
MDINKYSSLATQVRLDLLQNLLTSLEVIFKGHIWVVVTWAPLLFSYSLA